MPDEWVCYITPILLSGMAVVKEKLASYPQTIDEDKALLADESVTSMIWNCSQRHLGFVDSCGR